MQIVNGFWKVFGKTGNLVEQKSEWKRILEIPFIKHLRLHDLRRTLGSC